MHSSFAAGSPLWELQRMKVVGQGGAFCCGIAVIATTCGQGSCNGQPGTSVEKNHETRPQCKGTYVPMWLVGGCKSGCRWDEAHRTRCVSTAC